MVKTSNSKIRIHDSAPTTIQLNRMITEKHLKMAGGFADYTLGFDVESLPYYQTIQ